MNSWAVAIGRITPRRAFELYQQIERIEREREFGAETDSTVQGNKGFALHLLGRSELARAAYDTECRLAERRKDSFSQLHCMHGLASLMLDMGQPAQAREYLRRASEYIDTNNPPAVWPRLAAMLEGRLDLAAGRSTQAGAQFDRVLKNRTDDSLSITALLGKAELELIAANPTLAVAHARRALRIATSLQGGLPHSRETGLAWLTLGRALQGLGDRVQAHEAFEAAVTHLSNTVDADHPELVRARQLLDS